jgi:hypothetical protein
MQFLLEFGLYQERRLGFGVQRFAFVGLDVYYEAPFVSAHFVLFLSSGNRGIHYVAVLHAEESCPFQFNGYFVVGLSHQIAVFVNDLHEYVGYRIGS